MVTTAVPAIPLEQSQLKRLYLAKYFTWNLDKTTYNALFSMHGTIMIFLFVIPVFTGMANYVVPLMIGANDMAFPWLNAYSLSLILPAGILILLGYRMPHGGPVPLPGTSEQPVAGDK